MVKLIELNNINIPVPNNAPICLDELIIKPGDCIQIIAPSGRGKTYFYHTLLGMTESSPVLFGKNIHLAKLFCYLPSYLPFYSETVSDELNRLGATNDQITSFIDEGLITSVFLSQKCHTLSSGQNQILIFLRGLLSSKPILIMDELMNAMDEDLRNNIINYWIPKILLSKSILLSIHFNERSIANTCIRL